VRIEDTMPETKITIDVDPQGGQKTLVEGDAVDVAAPGVPQAAAAVAGGVNPAGGQKTKIVITITTQP
jgi:hypothetical protein